MDLPAGPGEDRELPIRSGHFGTQREDGQEAAVFRG